MWLKFLISKTFLANLFALPVTMLTVKRY